MTYDNDNIFAKILRDDAPAKIIYENDYAISFYNIYPASEIHALVIPRGAYTDIHDFTKNASDAEQIGFWRALHQTAEILGVNTNYSIVSNNGDGPFFKQSVFHFHVHLISGKPLKGGKL